MDEAALARIVDAIAQTVAEFDPAKVDGPVTIESFRRAFDQKLSAEDRALLDVDRMGEVDAALDRHSEAYAEAIRATGVPPVVVALLLSWFTIQLEARALHRQAVTRLFEIAAQSRAPSLKTTRTSRTQITAEGKLTLKKEVLRHLGVAPGGRLEVRLVPGGRVELRAVAEHRKD